jgi:GTP-binding protein
VVGYKEGLSFVIADIPGLIEGAHSGVGLGHQFLRHVERCRVLIHLVDCSGMDPERSPVKDFDTINRELALHSPGLAKKPQVVVSNKLDLTDAPAVFADFQKALGKRKIPVLGISGATGEGLPKLLDAVANLLFAAPQPEQLIVTAAKKHPVLAVPKNRPASAPQPKPRGMLKAKAARPPKRTSIKPHERKQFAPKTGLKRKPAAPKRGKTKAKSRR